MTNDIQSMWADAEPSHREAVYSALLTGGQGCLSASAIDRAKGLHVIADRLDALGHLFIAAAGILGYRMPSS